MYDYVTFLFPFTDEWLERSGWNRTDKGKAGPFDRIGDEIKGDL